MSLNMIGYGLSQLIEDEETPARMLGPLEALKQNTTFAAELKDTPPQKKQKKLPKIKKEEKQEYFEPIEMKRDPVELEN